MPFRRFSTQFIHIPELGWGNMTVARIKTVAFQGINTLEIDVQIQMANVIPAFTIVRLPDEAVGESRERVGRRVSSRRPPVLS